MSALRLAVLFSLSDKYLSQALAIITMAIMARLLTPAETGLFLVAQAVILLAESFRDFGIGSYIVQERNLGRAELRAAFTVSLLLSLLMGVAILSGSDWIAGWYGEPGVAPLLTVATLGFLIMPFGGPSIALLRREMRFQALAAINVAAAATNFAVTAGLGSAGLGAISYVWGSVISGAVVTALAIACRPEPGIFRPSLAGWRRVTSFGSVAVLVTVANMAYDLLPRLVLGRILGLGAVGLVVRATTVVQLPDRVAVQGLQPVVLSAMAALARSGGDLKQAYLRGHAMASALQWPALLMLALLADPVVRALLGTQWQEASSLVRILALGTMALAPSFMTYPLLVAAGRVRDALTASLISLPPSVLIILLAAHQGLEAVAVGMALVAPLQMLTALVFVRRATGLTWADLANSSAASVAVSASTLVLPMLVVLWSPTGLALDWSQTAAAVAGGALGWAAGIWLTGHALTGEVVGLWRHVAARRRISGAGVPGAAPSP